MVLFEVMGLCGGEEGTGEIGRWTFRLFLLVKSVLGLIH